MMASPDAPAHLLPYLMPSVCSTWSCSQPVPSTPCPLIRTSYQSIPSTFFGPSMISPVTAGGRFLMTLLLLFSYDQDHGEVRSGVSKRCVKVRVVVSGAGVGAFLVAAFFASA